ncbi:DUF427 domain-containing protein [Gilvimarinus sp. F26214L]|uniref:DUF427 domain-containing protein n=1 Tax=Gilvimarinus sp. DZF01 TaxID=3461371 RepID=UPI004046416B
MTHSPGHRKWPDHKVEEKQLSDHVQVLVRGEVIADSQHVIEVDETEHPARFYIPKSDVDMSKLSPSDQTSTCPFKGRASYYNLADGQGELQDAAWSYDDPYEEHADLKDHIAFYDDKPEIEVKRIH